MEYFDGKCSHFEHQCSIYPSKTIFQLPVFDLPCGTTNIPTTVPSKKFRHNTKINSNRNSAPSKKYSIYFRITIYLYLHELSQEFGTITPTNIDHDHANYGIWTSPGDLKRSRCPATSSRVNCRDTCPGPWAANVDLLVLLSYAWEKICTPGET